MAAPAKPATVLLDVPMTSEQLAEIECAAALSDLDAPQWGLQNLLACARRGVQAATTTHLSCKAFDAFKTSLNEGMPQETKELLRQKPVWE